jgi:hypothetical protein
MRTERDHHTRQRSLGGFGHHAAYKLAVAVVHTVKIADGDTRPAGKIKGYFLKLSCDLHGVPVLRVGLGAGNIRSARRRPL